MDTVLVTGGRGASGRWVVDRLAGDYEVVVVDYDHPGLGVNPASNVSFRAADLAEREQALDVVAAVDPDAVVHWAAIPVAGTHPEGRVFETNALAAKHVLDAAGRAGAPVVQASSDGAYGFFFAEPTPFPDELPVTEGHPLRPEDPYGLSKVTAEAAAGAVARRHGVSAVSVRPSWIQYPGDYACRADEYVTDLEAGAGNFWSYVDVRDVADLVAAALADLLGDDSAVALGTHEAINCVAADNALGRPLLELLRESYGEVSDDCAVDGSALSEGDDRGAYAVAKAEQLFGWTPSRSWRDAADEAVTEPALFEG
ncbi:NAD-dependent epimerase/dehydratase family protein [Halorubrum ezzemoulense]|uniref:NAD-dependent epimerase/dehydratase family protein n=1 Tax=Halorubrum ezzemoulense TaxID=337243 RepID=UPI00232B746B|nr:NAD(P)-dependent oxidoreductase [Halorubrum ezzemoulense]MDB2238354.1 NAD(P)-dependent oxidoreductase [Halorubrum ezzemoulense]MDB2247823.1 NAD(P)-dependent oxidoreductase [Halorubrum ezzemoulense]